MGGGQGDGAGSERNASLTLNRSLFDEFAEAGAGLAAASRSFDTTTPTGRAMLGMLAVFAELQRAEIRERTRCALAGKAARGEATGRTHTAYGGRA